jgi:hypothetical protein
MILAQCYVDYMHVNFINCSNIRRKNYFAWLPDPSFLQKYLFWKKKKMERMISVSPTIWFLGHSWRNKMPLCPLEGWPCPALHACMPARSHITLT